MHPPSPLKAAKTFAGIVISFNLYTHALVACPLRATAVRVTANQERVSRTTRRLLREGSPPLRRSLSKSFANAGQQREEDGAWAIAAHGGAGAISDTASIPARLKEFEEAFAVGKQMLEAGATALDAVQEVVARLEDSAYFNAGRGSVFTNAGTHEMDASIMDGTSGMAGAVAMVSNIKNPIRLARTVANNTQHVMLCGVGASSLAPPHGIEVEDNHYFFTEERYKQLQNARLTNRIILDHGGEMPQDHKSVRIDTSGTVKTGHLTSPLFQPLGGILASPLHQPTGTSNSLQDMNSLDLNTTSRKAPKEKSSSGWAEEHKFGTVGCVARDKYGELPSVVC